MIQEDFPLSLKCGFKGAPLPRASWLFNGADVKHLPLDGVITNFSAKDEVHPTVG